MTIKISRKVKAILEQYRSENAGVRGKLATLLGSGRLGGSGKLLILPVDQGFEHGPTRSFEPNPEAYDPLYHWQLAIDAGLSAFAAPLGMLEAGADQFVGQVPTILKLNSSNSLTAQADQAITGSIEDALRLGCTAVGFTIYPGADANFAMLEEIQALTAEAKAVGLAVVVWSYPRGGLIPKEAETAVDVVAYAAHMAALAGAHLIKVKPPSETVLQPESSAVFSQSGRSLTALSERIAFIMQSAFAGRRIVVFSGGNTKGTDALLEEIRGLRDGGAHGSIVGRNAFQRPRAEALALLDAIVQIYLGKA